MADRFENRTISLDGETFTDATFRHCSLQISGGDAPKFLGERPKFFSGCELLADGHAREAMDQLKSLWSIPTMQNIIRRFLMDSISKDVFKPGQAPSADD